jgi:hypothetical protein
VEVWIGHSGTHVVRAFDLLRNIIEAEITTKIGIGSPLCVLVQEFD